MPIPLKKKQRRRLNRICNWVDIRYYNYYKFKPYDFPMDKTELLRAIRESEKAIDNIVQ